MKREIRKQDQKKVSRTWAKLREEARQSPALGPKTKQDIMKYFKGNYSPDWLVLVHTP